MSLERVGRAALALTVFVWAGVLAFVLRHRIFVSHDTMISYAHVWYVSARLWHGHGLPLRMPLLSHGEAFTFPYGLVPWLSAAIVRPIVGDWVVTCWLVLGAIGVAAATLWAFPELRRGWWATAVLVNPALVAGALIGQLPFLWASALFITAIGCWRRQRVVAAVVCAALAQITHAAVLIPIAAALVVLWLPFEPDRRALVRAYAISLVPALPAVWIVWRSPVFVESSTWVKFFNFFDTVGPRTLIVAVPVALVVLHARTRARPWVAPVAVVVLLGANIATSIPMGMPQAWRALVRYPETGMAPFLDSADFVPGATYRLLYTSNGKLGMYQLIRHGGRLDSEFFPESIQITSFHDTRAYSDFLTRRHVDDVMVWHSYDRRWHTNEHALLDQLTHGSSRTCSAGLVSTRHIVRNPRYDVYAVDRKCASASAT